MRRRLCDRQKSQNRSPVRDFAVSNRDHHEFLENVSTLSMALRTSSAPLVYQPEPVTLWKRPEISFAECRELRWRMQKLLKKRQRLAQHLRGQMAVAGEFHAGAAGVVDRPQGGKDRREVD